MSKILVANWKEYGTLDEVSHWISTMAREKPVLSINQIIVCPPFTTLAPVSQLLKEQKLPIAVGAQDVSRFDKGKHTGEICATVLSEVASHVIIGHSERRRDFGETNEIVAEKVRQAKKYRLSPIVCISKIDEVAELKNLLGNFQDTIAYEPLFAIGSGNPDTPENANNIASQIKETFSEVAVLYGGSVDGGNVKSFLNQRCISGVLVGNRSLEPAFFLEIVKNAH